MLQYQVLRNNPSLTPELAIQKFKMKILANEIKPGMIINHKMTLGVF